MDLLEQIDEYQEEVNSHKQALQSLEEKYNSEIEVLRNQVANL
jgi:vacuolar-type H+-ATPase subunit I/STV1